MDIKVQLAFNEAAALRLLNWLADENALIIHEYDQAAWREGRRPLPLLYTSGARYEREKIETWSDYLNLLEQGHEDCDALAAARAGELLARGWRALLPPWEDMNDEFLDLWPDYDVRFPGDEGYYAAQRSRPEQIYAEVYLATDSEPGMPGLFHCVVRYWINGVEYRDDPSARLGMNGSSAEVRRGLARVA